MASESPATATTVRGRASTHSIEPELVVIRPRGVFSIDVRELWAYRELLGVMVWRDIKVRYKQTFLGVGWAVLQPVVSMVIFSVIFGNFAKIPSGDLPYPLFAFAGLLPWVYFSTCMTSTSGSIVSNSNLVTKVYFPRLIVPLAACVTPAVDFVLSFIVLLGMMTWYGIWPSWHVVVLPVLLVMALVTSLGVGLWLATLNVRYRDIPYTIPFLAQVWMYASPVVYPVSIVPRRWQWVLGLNPMTGVIEGVRWALLDQQAPTLSVIIASVAVGIVLLTGGLAYFRKGERHFADVI
jgi:lipopolysaccharide transport system permease protein